MLRLFGADACPLPEGRPVVTMGVFDGVHVGHREVFSQTVGWARELKQSSLVLTFDIHPLACLAPGHAPRMITSLEHRLVLLEREGIDAVWVLPFDARLAAVKAEAFVRQILVGKVGASAVVLGSDALFGRDREGGLATIVGLSSELGLAVREVPPVLARGRPVSSTSIRTAVSAGELDLAASMLGRPVSVLGTVVAGIGLGRSLGFPTLNLDLHHELRPPQGVYVSTTRWGDSSWPSVTNVGHRPTIDARETGDVLIESHLLDGAGELYGQVVEVCFLKRLREERRFPDHASLARQIGRDASAARAFFADRRPRP